MKARGSMTSERTGTSTPPKNITSTVTREGDAIGVDLRNDAGDIVLVSMTGAGDISVCVRRGDTIKTISLDAPARQMRQDAKAEMAGGYPY